MLNHIATMKFADRTTIELLLIGQKIIAMELEETGEAVQCESSTISEIIEGLLELRLDDLENDLENIKFYNMNLIPENLLEQLTRFQ